jgi:putative ATPase
MELFRQQKKKSYVPLADRIRPKNIREIVGQRHLLAPGKILFCAIKGDEIFSMILWGPPGCGKTTIARLISYETKANFVGFSAVLSGISEIKKIIDKASYDKTLYQKKTILFIDEIHRFNKAQQDAFLPYVEDGTIILIGATVENPCFSINSALLSRCRIFRLEPLSKEDILTLLKRAVSDKERGLPSQIVIDSDTLSLIASLSQGDARQGLNILEMAYIYTTQEGIKVIDQAVIQQVQDVTPLLYDKSGEEHYNLISAFIKSLRGSDPDAAVYWMARMIEAGEDPLFILRRMIIFASEDIGNADPYSLDVAVSAYQAFERVGLPEGILPLTQAAIYLACAEKSNSALLAYQKAKKDLKKYGALPVPMKLRNPVTAQMKEWGYGKGYKYPHDFDKHFLPETYLPEKLVGRRYYLPSDNGYEIKIKKRLQALREIKEES